jgi:hypothetical protein
MDGGNGIYFANYAPAFPVVGCIVIRQDKSRVLAHVMPDPLAESESDS